ncbi:hypothetical protein COOONC_28146 [Cooperia oncophora]
MRRTCALCGKVSCFEHMKRMNHRKKQNLIMVASLSFLGIVDRSKVDAVVANISRASRCICHSHVIRAAQYLCAEVTISGARLLYDDAYKAAYFPTTDIPSHLAEVINRTSNAGDVITTRDVGYFINGSLMRYYGTPAWPSNYEEEESEEAVPGSNESALCSKLPADGQDVNVDDSEVSL